MDELEKMKKGYLWNDCEQYLEEQRLQKNCSMILTSQDRRRLKREQRSLKNFLDTAGKMSGSTSQWRFSAGQVQLFLPELLSEKIL